ncbi:MAG: hypothetical protein M1819_004295 [Sarea resinae]|nr:MAG: hypothetical protein M1819_004295 [Sarea resinae]
MTAIKKKSAKRPASLSHGRPPQRFGQKPPASLSAKATRALIRKHHHLQKELAKALSSGDGALARTLEIQIEQHGGLKSYQQASITGQSSERGGDSSRVLMEWLTPVHAALRARAKEENGEQKLRLLEVGALSKSNACSRSGLFDVSRIDLNSQDESSILQQDFMERPLPAAEHDTFDVISLSLVLNYVPDAVTRGEMLRRTCQFLRHRQAAAGAVEKEGGAPPEPALFPSLFLVLPLPCINNSRYLDRQKLHSIMTSLGYILVHEKTTAKLVYYLWRCEPQAPSTSASTSSNGRPRSQTFKKVEVHPGKTRNNFAIILR